MVRNRFLLPAIALALVTLGAGASRSAAVPQPNGYGQDRDRDRDWDTPPREFNDLQRRGFRDGVEGARRDFGNHRRPDVNNREEYRNGNQPEPYRAGFRRGYEMAASHLWGGGPSMPPPPPPVVVQPRQDWDRWGMRGLENDAQRRGYREGVEEARHDVQFNRNQDPDDQPQFRNPPVSRPLVDDYREGFMRGYEVSLSQLRGEGSWEGRGDPGQWTPPDRFTEWQRRGFSDGVDGARKDFGNHRRANVSNREEYRDPRVPPEFVREYRQGFRRGYEMGANRLWGGN